MQAWLYLRSVEYQQWLILMMLFVGMFRVLVKLDAITGSNSVDYCNKARKETKLEYVK